MKPWPVLRALYILLPKLILQPIIIKLSYPCRLKAVLGKKQSGEERRVKTLNASSSASSKARRPGARRLATNVMNGTRIN